LDQSQNNSLTEALWRIRLTRLAVCLPCLAFKDVSPLYGRAMVQLSELYSYFSGDTLYVPGDAEDGGLEEAQPLAKQASQLDPSIQLMRRNLCEAIESLLSSYLSLAPCCMACLMDPSGKGAALPSKAAEMAWRTLQKEVLEADGHQCRAEQPSSNPSSASAAFSTGCSVADTEAGAGDLANSLREHREQSTLQEFLEYKRMPPLTNFRSGALEWWAHRVGRGSASSLSSFEAPTALGAVAAKYCSMDAVHCPVESLFEGMSQRVLELLVNLKQSDVVAMLFLRMNSALLLPSNEP